MKNVLNNFTIRSLKLNIKRTIATCMGIIMSTALICAVAGVFSSFQQTLIKHAKDSDGDYHAVFFNVKPNEQKYILENRRKHLPNELSGGQQQRVSIGRAIINNPAIMLADEPTGNLDSKASEEIISLLRLSNKKYNQTVIVITHDEKIALEADRIITIDDGKIIKDERTGK